jgi:hypothetical protein
MRLQMHPSGRHGMLQTCSLRGLLPWYTAAACQRLMGWPSLQSGLFTSGDKALPMPNLRNWRCHVGPTDVVAKLMCYRKTAAVLRWLTTWSNIWARSNSGCAVAAAIVSTLPTFASHPDLPTWPCDPSRDVSHLCAVVLLLLFAVMLV